MVHWEREVRSLLRPSEHLHLLLVGTAFPNELPRTRVHNTREPSVLLAVVGHIPVGGRAVEDSGSVFIYRKPERNHHTASTVVHGSLLTLQHIFPIHGDFSLEISQHSALSPADPDVSMIDGPPSTPTDTGFSVRLTEGGNIFTIVTYDMGRLSEVASACRGLRDLALMNASNRGSFRWLKPYSFPPASWISVKPPRDLRHEYRPVLFRLSQGCAGTPGDDAVDYTMIRDDWLYSKSRSTIHKESEQKQLSIRAGTFNVNGKLPFQDLSTWLGGARPSSDTHNDKQGPSTSGGINPLPLEGTSDNHMSEPDLLGVALQEVDQSTEALFYTTNPAREDAWMDAILAALGKKADKYEKLASKQLVGILLIILVKKDLHTCFTEARESYVTSGIMGVMVNRNQWDCYHCSYHDSPGKQGGGCHSAHLSTTPYAFCTDTDPNYTHFFVGSHLAAFEEQLERRNTEFHDISRRLTFGPCAEYLWGPHANGTGEGLTMLDIYASDFLLWMGGELRWMCPLDFAERSAPTCGLEDLNYRLNLPDADVRHLLSVAPVAREISTLLEFDQLRNTIHYAKAFAEFEEHPIDFLPTYRFNSELQTDRLGYDTKRKPAWTDRILYMSSSFVRGSQRSYNAHPHITMSDHKPVSAEFLVNIPCVDSLALDSVANNLYKSVASFDSERPSGIPLLKVDQPTLDFGNVSYSVPISRNLCIRNTGKVPAAFRFLFRDLSSAIHPRWLKIETMTGFLLPGEEMNIQFTILVSPAIAAPLNLKIQKLSTLLVLHTILGQDLFLSLNAEYEQTCFGTHLSALARLPGPIRELKGTRDLLPEPQALNSSREFSKLIGWLMSHDVETVHDLFISPGDDELASQIRESLDTGADLPPYPTLKAPCTVDANYARTVAAVLLAFLGSLPESVVPPSLHQRCSEATSRDAAFELLSVFPPSSVNVWISMTAFLHLLTLKSQQLAEVGEERGLPTFEVSCPVNSQSHAETLASIFAPILLRDDIDTAFPVSLLGKKKFLLYFMEGP